MGRKLLTSVLTSIWVCSCGQSNTIKTAKVAIVSALEASTDTTNKPWQDPNLDKYIYSDTTYTSFSGKGITIQNSFPKGGMISPDGTQYVDSLGKRYGFVVFWTRIINDTESPLALDIHISADSYAIFTPPGSCLRLLLPQESVAFDKLSEFNYGLTDLKPYLDANLYKTSALQKTINPNEAHVFFVAALTYKAAGTPRAAMILKEQDLYYSMGLAPDGSGTIPIGKITIQ